jgi:hypothetical protein
MQGGGENGRTWAMFMVAGGHFAGAVVRVSRPDQHDMDDAKTKKNLKRPIPDTEVIRHKTFHRYTSLYTSLFGYSLYNFISHQLVGSRVDLNL